jgi:hypothetical protein
MPTILEFLPDGDLSESADLAAIAEALDDIVDRLEGVEAVAGLPGMMPREREADRLAPGYWKPS